jgi:hypothetical protein
MKDNPKSIPGRKKFAFSVMPFNVLVEVSLAMLEGALKYGRFNWRTGPPIRVSDYLDALMRHVTAYAEGQDIDPDSGRHHLVKAAATLFVLIDSILCGRVVDDRAPPASADCAWIDEANTAAAGLREKHSQ